MRMLFLLAFFISSIIVQSQSPDGLEKSKISFTKRDSLLQERELAILESYDLNEIHKDALWAYYLYKSSLHFYMGKDSVLYNLNVAFSKSERAVCGCVLSTEDLFNNVIMRGKEPPEFSWFLWDLPSDTEAYIRKRCSVYIEKFNNDNSRLKSDLETFIMSNDQKYRSTNNPNWELQNSLDLLNRNYLDSLYQRYESFSSFSTYELDAFSFVLHHSDDCDWNKKWFLIWFHELDKNKLIGGKLFGPAIKRMLEPETGVCWLRDPDDTQAFIEKLNNKYSNKLAIEHGISGN